MSGSVHKRHMDDSLIAELEMKDYRTSPAGDILYVDNSGIGHAIRGSFSTLAQAIDNVRKEGSVIHILPGHSETLSGAGAITVRKNGLTIVGRGWRSNSSSLTFSTTATTIAVTGSGVRFINMNFIAGVSGVVLGIDIQSSGKGCEILDCNFTAGSGVSFVTAIQSAGANGLVVKGNEINQTVAGTNTISASSTTQNARIENNVVQTNVTGSFLKGVWTKVGVFGNYVLNSGTGANAIIDMDATSSGFIDFNHGFTGGAIATAISPDGCTMGIGNSVSNAAGEIGAVDAAIGTVST